MRRLFPHKRVPYRYASLAAVAVLLALAAGALRAAAGEGLTGPAAGEAAAADGRLVLITADPLDGDARETRSLPALQGEDGRLTMLRVDPASPLAERLYGLDGRQVRVSGTKGREMGGLLVSGVEAVAGRQSAAQVAVRGPQSVLNILCYFADAPDDLTDPAYFSAMLAADHPGLGDYWRELSYGAATLDPVLTRGWVPLPHERARYVQGDDVDLAALANDCLGAAGAQAERANFDVVNLFFNQTLGCCAYGGGNTTWLGSRAAADVSILAHEMGHAFGLPHSGGPEGLYTSSWDVMSYGPLGCRLPAPASGCLPQHTIGYHKALLGWLGEDEIFDAPPSGSATVTLQPLSAASGGYQMLRIPLSGSGDLFYTVENRALQGYDRALLGAGAIIHHVQEGRLRRAGGTLHTVPAIVVDGDGNNDANDAGAVWLPGESFRDEAQGLSISVAAAPGDALAVTVSRTAVPFSCDAAAGVPPQECATLLSLFESWDGPQWARRDGWRAWPDVCNWYGVTCEGEHVTAVQLPGNTLSGSIPAAIAGLPHLERLDLADNDLGGALPPQLGDLQRLEHLNLAATAVRGPLPAELGGLARLGTLYLEQTSLEGPLPLDLANLASLRRFRFDGTRLCTPADRAFLAWLNRLDHQDSGLRCAQLYPFAVHLPLVRK